MILMWVTGSTKLKASNVEPDVTVTDAGEAARQSSRTLSSAESLTLGSAFAPANKTLAYFGSLVSVRPMLDLPPDIDSRRPATAEPPNNT